MVVAYVCAYVRGRSNGERKEKVSFIKEQYEREQEKRRQYKLQAKWSSSSIDRPSARDDAQEKEEEKTPCIYVFEASRRREREKSRGGEDDEEEEGCTYTNAIERVSAPVEKKRRESFLVRDACCYVIVDENEVHRYNYHHHLFF